MLAHQIPVILGGGFDPSVIFAEMPGAWFEYRIGGMWQENTGATPTTSGGQTIGLLLGLDQQQQLGPELVTNGAFDTDTGWSKGSGWTISGGKANVNNAAVFNLGQAIPDLVNYAVISVTFTVSNYVSGDVKPYLHGSIIGGGYLGIGTARNTNGTFTQLLMPNRTSTNLIFQTGASGANLSIDNVSVTGTLGNHAYQATAANRPTLQYNGTLPLARHDGTDVLVASMPNLGGGVFSGAGSVYYVTGSAVTALHDQAIGTSYNLPGTGEDVYGYVITPARLVPPLESRLERYLKNLAGLV